MVLNRLQTFENRCCVVLPLLSLSSTSFTHSSVDSSASIHPAKILLPEGSDAPINELIGILVAEKSDIEAFKDYTGDVGVESASAGRFMRRMLKTLAPLKLFHIDRANQKPL